jgi:hypothetical protein
MATQSNRHDVTSDQQFVDLTRSGGGASRRASDGRAANIGDSGYMVGGLGETRTVPSASFSAADAHSHLQEIVRRFPTLPELHQGSWDQDGSVQLDASTRHASKGSARLAGLMRVKKTTKVAPNQSAASDSDREQAIFDLKNGEDIDLPRRAVK